MRITLRLSVFVLALGGSLTPSALAVKPTPQEEKLVQEISQQLLKEMDPVPGFQWKPDIKAIADEEPDVIPNNAWATARVEKNELIPVVRITGEFLRGIRDEHGVVDRDALALILAHELGHIHHRHMFKGIDKPELVAFAFNREKEYEADAFGAFFLQKAHFSLVQGILGMTRMKSYRLHQAPLDHLRSTHPAWDERFGRVVQDPHLWELMATFDNGTALLAAEQFAAAERCFDSVAAADPACYEALVNLGYARLMQYCDKLSETDLKDLGIGQLLCGAFYRRPVSLEVPRGKDTRLWKGAVDALREALRLKPGLALANANLGLAYLVNPDGKQADEAVKRLRQAQHAQGDEKTLRAPDESGLADQVGLQVNLAVALLAAGDVQGSMMELAQACDLLQKLHWWEATLPTAAVHYNQALAHASAGSVDEKRAAIQLFEQYLREGDSLSSWWPVAYERYGALCKELQVKPAGREELQGRTNTELRRQLTLSLNDGQAVTLGEKTQDVLARLGKPKDKPVEVLKGILNRYRLDKYGIELLASDRVIAIFVRSRQAPPVVLKPRGLASGQPVELRVGMSYQELVAKMPGARMVVGRYLLESAEENLYRYYRHLGLAVRYDADPPSANVTELVIVQVPEPLQKKAPGIP